MITKFKLYENNNTVSYMKIKSLLSIYNKKILQSNREKLRINEYQTLYDYYLYLSNTSIVRFNNVDVDGISKMIIEWIEYLILIQIYENDLINGRIYTNAYNEIKSIPELIDDNSINIIVSEYLYKPESPTRQCLMLLETRVNIDWEI